ncbi:DUF554 domain-containing protein [Ancylobacter sp. Lp-2]|uniref:DUF554 domain-containing protein n=1 Tax=Ancylobacter sp. Lp-2 TaxID=2881339 RepID=UPI001E2B3D0E|nr:DUF554 domain-containing protein [Ancylobacter sp. Lp-2]MCB4771924.1 DUF554 domain-containing protein [Ancylobacter sp. Lp-2]
MIGPIVNSCCILLGGVAGAAFGRFIPERVRFALPMTLGAAAMAMGVVLLAGVAHLPAVVLALLAGAIIGELINIERHLGSLGHALHRLIGRFSRKPSSTPHEAFIDQFVAILVLFCASGTGVFGAMHEGMTGDPSILLAKSALDLVSAIIFATSLGYAVALIAVPQLLIQLALAFGAVFIMPMTDKLMNADFSAVGGIIVFVTGFRICGIKSFPVANMLPALVLVMPVSALWARFF